MPFDSWPPTEAEFYRPHSAATPVWQGDIFENVPIVKAKATGAASRQPELGIERRAVLITTYACDLYRPATAAISEVVAVFPLVDVTGRGQNAWKGGMYSRCPLPPTARTDRIYAADLQVPSTVDSKYLVVTKRLHALTIAALSFLYQRLVLATTRVVASLDYFESQLGPLEHERQLWESWVTSGGGADDFEKWLDTPLARAGGMAPRRWLDRGSFFHLDEEARVALRKAGLAPAF